MSALSVISSQYAEATLRKFGGLKWKEKLAVLVGVLLVVNLITAMLMMHLMEDSEDEELVHRMEQVRNSLVFRRLPLELVDTAFRRMKCQTIKAGEDIITMGEEGDSYYIITGGKAEGVAIEAGVGRFVYWLIMFFVLMAVLQSLGLTIVTEPINAFVTKIVGFLPQILAAAVLAAIAWAVASVLRVVVANLLGAFQIDQKLGDKAGDEMKKVSLASTVADAVYYLIWLLFLPQIIDALQMEGLSPVKDMVGQILGFLPSLFGALIIFFLFYVVARIVQRLATSLLAGIGFDRLPEWLGLGAPRSGPGSASATWNCRPGHRNFARAAHTAIRTRRCWRPSRERAPGVSSPFHPVRAGSVAPGSARSAYGAGRSRAWRRASAPSPAYSRSRRSTSASRCA